MLHEDVIDCFFVGHNDMGFQQYEGIVASFGKDNPYYRDLMLNFIYEDGSPVTLPDIYNRYSQSDLKLGISSILNPAIAYLGSYIYRAGFTFDFVNSFDIGGPFIYGFHISDAMESCWNQVNADVFVISNQGEATLVKVLRDNLSLGSITNIMYSPRGRVDFSEVKIAPYVRGNTKLEENLVDWDLFRPRARKFTATRALSSVSREKPIRAFRTASTSSMIAGMTFFRVQRWCCDPTTPIWNKREQFKIDERGEAQMRMPLAV